MATESASPVVRVGGQAVIEGVMMRAGDRACVAVRRPDGAIVQRMLPTRGWADAWSRVPLLRGIAALSESLTVGIEALRWSETQAGGGAHAGRRPAPLWVSLVLALGVVIALVVVIPAVLAGLVASGSTQFALMETLVRVLLAGTYVSVVAQRSDVARVFEYHGAEHLVVGAHESGTELVPSAIRSGSIHHPRCGTSFLLVISAVAALVHPFLPVEPVPSRLLARIVVVPVVAAVAFEVLTAMGAWATAHRGGRVEAALLWPQRFTTRPPDDAQIEVAVAALRGALDATSAPAGAGALRLGADQIRRSGSAG